MHISEGILAAPVLLGGGAVAAAALAVGLKKLDYDRLVPTGVLSAAFFVSSLLQFPVGPGSAHLLLNGLLGALLGWGAVPAICVALVLQALLFQFGGLTTLGVNLLIMAAPAVLAGALLRAPALGPRQLRVRGFFCGVLAVTLSAVLFSAVLALSSERFHGAATVVLVAHLPLALAEGFVTSTALSFLYRVQPELLALNREAS